MADPTESEMMADLAAADSAGDTELAQHIAGRIKAARTPKYSVGETAAMHAPNAVMLGLGPLAAEAVKSQGMETVPGSGEFMPEPGVSVPARTTEGPGRIETARALKASAEQNPKTALAASVAGGMGSPAALVAPTSLLPRTLAGVGAGGLYGFGGSTAQDMPNRLSDAALPAVLGGAVSAAAPAVAKGVGWAAGKASNALGDVAERAAVRSANADRTAYRRVLQSSAEKAHSLGRWLLDQGVPLRSPGAMKEATGQILSQEGPQIGALTQAGDKAGATVDLGALRNKILSSGEVAALGKNTETRPLLGRIQAFFDDQLAQHGQQVPASVAHDIRMQIDPLAQWDKSAGNAAKPLADAFKAARGEVSDALGESLSKVGLGDAWSKVNAQFSRAAQAHGLSRIGAERREANKLFQLGEWGVGGAGATAAAMGHPAAALPAALAIAGNRYGMPVTAKTADFLARRLAAPTLEEMAPRAADLAAIRLGQRLPQPQFLLQSAAANQEGQ